MSTGSSSLKYTSRSAIALRILLQSITAGDVVTIHHKKRQDEGPAKDDTEKDAATTTARSKSVVIVKDDDNNNNNVDPNATAKECKQNDDHTQEEREEPYYRPIIEIPASYTPLRAVQILWNNHILSAPVYDANEGKYCGFLDMRDLTSTIVKSHQFQIDSSSKTATTKDLLSRWLQQQTITSKLAERNPFLSCTWNSSLLDDVAPHLTNPKCHRIPIVDERTGRCQAMITQGSFIQAVAHYMLEEKDTTSFEETLQESKFPYRKQVITATDTTRALDVFDLMVQKGLSGIAIVDADTGRLVGNTSARDIRLSVTTDLLPTGSTSSENIDDDNMTDITRTDILSYLAAVRQATSNKKDRYPAAAIKETSTIQHAIQLLAKTGYHRLFVVDAYHKPVGVFSVTDVMRFIVG